MRLKPGASLTLVWTALWLVACADPPTPSSAAGPVAEGVEARVGQGADSFLVQAGRVWLTGSGTARAADARVALSEPSGVPLVVEAPSSEWDLAGGLVVFEGGVTVTRGDLRITCDRLEVTWQGAGEVTRAVGTGHLTLEHRAWKATAQRGELFTAEERVVLEGSPRVEQEGRTLDGQRIELSLADERVRCEGCRLVVPGGAPP